MPKAEDLLQPRGTPQLQRARGRGALRTKLVNSKTRISELYQDGCAKIRLPKTHSAALEAVLINTAGGLTGDDVLEWDIETAPETSLVLTTQAAERVYRSTGGDACIEAKIKVGAGAQLDWLPQETILFEQSKLSRNITVDLDEGARFTGVEAMLLGREAMGEAARTAMLSDRWLVRRCGKLIHMEANRLSANDLERDALSLLAGNNAFATIVHISETAETRVSDVRALVPEGAKAAVSGIGERLIVRLLAPSGLALRRLITPIIDELAGAGSVPRLWTT